MIFETLIFTYLISPFIKHLLTGVLIWDLISVSSVGVMLGITGGILNCSTCNSHKVIGFSVWIISNTTLAYWAFSKGDIDIMYMYIFYFGTSSVGLYNHLKPKHILPQEGK